MRMKVMSGQVLSPTNVYSCALLYARLSDQAWRELEFVGVPVDDGSQQAPDRSGRSSQPPPLSHEQSNLYPMSIPIILLVCKIHHKG